MKMTKSFLARLAIAFLFISCTESVNDNDISNEKENVVKKTPEGFVLVKGTTVYGDDKFSNNGWNGVFVKDRVVKIKDFYMCDHEVTQAEYESITGNNPSKIYNNLPEDEVIENYPVQRINWYDAIVYCNLRSIKDKLTPCYKLDGKIDPAEWGKIPTSKTNVGIWDSVTCDWNANGYRLPTEVEWEYAALGGQEGVSLSDPTDYSGTNDKNAFDQYAWDNNNSNHIPHEVKKKEKNILDLYDMSGNVWECCWDWKEEIIVKGDNITPVTGPDFGEVRVIRGGSFISGRVFCSVACRDIKNPDIRYPYQRFENIGFRVVRNVD